MSDHDIDKYFRDHLKGVEEPISPNDWKAFEKMAVAKRSNKWLYLLLLLPVIGVATYILYPNTTQTDFSETNPKESNIENQQSKIETISNLAESSNQNDNSQSNTTNELDSDNAASSGNGLSESQGTVPISQSESQNLNSTYENFGKNGNQQTETPNTDRPTKVSETIDNRGLAKKGDDTAKPIGTISPTEAAGITGAKTARGARTNNGEASTETNSFARSTNSASEMETDYEMLELIGLSEIETDNIPQLNSDLEQITIPAFKSWNVDAFAQYELNNELGGIPSAGFISSWQKNKWNIGIGLGIGQSGKLNWTQTREDVVYGFDVYEENYQLQTKNFTFLSMPIHLAYRVLPRSDVFIGFTPEMIINASQAYGITESNQDQSTGYLYQTGAPTLMFFINAGYGFSITDYLKLDLGIDYSPQKWDVTENKPLGGFIRLKYNIR